MAGKITVDTVQLGDNSTPSRNFVWRTNNDGSAKLSRGNAEATTQDILMVDANGKIIFVQGSGNIPNTQSMVRLHTAGGYGSVNTCIRRFGVQVTNQGTDITYSDSGTLGAAFTINTAGVYSISYSDRFNTAGSLGISVNTTQPATPIGNITAADRLIIAVTAATDFPNSVSWTGYLPAGSVVRPHGAATPSGTSPDHVSFTIARTT
jgi:hypothetical protein